MDHQMLRKATYRQCPFWGNVECSWSDGKGKNVSLERVRTGFSKEAGRICLLGGISERGQTVETPEGPCRNES